MNKRIKGYIGATFFSILCILTSYYFTFPAINIHNIEFWMYLLFISVLVGGSFVLVSAIWPKDIEVVNEQASNQSFKMLLSKMPWISKVCFGICAVSLLVPLLGNIWASPLFHAKDYASLLQVEEVDFSENMIESTNIKDIA